MKRSVQSLRKHIPEDRLKTLSSSKTKTLILSQFKSLKTSTLQLEKVEKLAIAPNLSEEDHCLVILAFVKTENYISVDFIQPIIARAIQCQDEDVVILNSSEIRCSYQEGCIDTEEYNKLMYASLPFECFEAETNEELNQQFDEKYNKFVSSLPIDTLNQAQYLADRSLQIPKLKESFVSTFEEFRVPTLKEIAKEWDPRIKTLLELLVERKIKHLKKLADQQYLEVSEGKCNKIIIEFGNIQEIKIGKTTALHLVAEKKSPFQNKKLSIGEAMAIMKKLLGVDANLKTGEKMMFLASWKIQDINCQDEEGRTALHLAAKSAGGILYWLLVLKADPTIQDNNGKTVLDYIPRDWVNVRKSVKQYLKYW